MAPSSEFDALMANVTRRANEIGSGEARASCASRVGKRSTEQVFTSRILVTDPDLPAEFIIGSFVPLRNSYERLLDIVISSSHEILDVLYIPQLLPEVPSRSRDHKFIQFQLNITVEMVSQVFSHEYDCSKKKTRNALQS